MNTAIIPKKRSLLAMFSVAILLALGASNVRGYTLPADRATTWNPGLNSAGGIPNRTTISATLTPLGGGQDDSPQIRAAVNACPSGQVVLLSAGTFTVNNLVLIDKAITLRGSGPGVTILRKTNGAILNSTRTIADLQPIIIVGPGRWVGSDSTTSQNLTANGAKGAMSVTVANATGFTAGQFVILDELSGASWQTDRIGLGQVWASPDFRVTWQYHNPGIQYVDDPLNITTTPTSGAAGWFSRNDRPTNEMKEIASVAGNVITFTSPLHIDYRTANTAQLTRYTVGAVHIKNAGVEDLSVTGGSDGAIRFECAAYSWAKNVEVSIWAGDGVNFANSFRVELRDSYIHDAAFGSPGGGAYAIGFGFGASEILVENNISIRANKVMVARCSGTGSVVGYNYMDDGYINYAPGWPESGVNGSHMVGSHHMLFEGNYGFNFDSDFTHGNSIYHTVFRNWFPGFRRPMVNPLDGATIDDANQPENGPKRCIGASTYSYWMSFVGNVLGASGQMSGWVYNGTGNGAWSTPSIWLLGYGTSYDSQVEATSIRDGNWDWLQSMQSWHNTSAVTLQNSMYLSAKPAFFGSNTWPWVNPTTGTTYTLPAKARYEAMPAIPVPSTPTGLTATPGNAQVVLNWNASSGALCYNIYRGTSPGGEGTTAVAPGIVTTTYTDTGLAGGTTYYYVVKAVNTTGHSGISNEASATPIVPPAPPAPTGLAATAGNAQVALNWSASTDATSYNVYRGTSAGGESTTAVVTGVTATTYTNTSLTNGTTYYYK
ncbi:MAG: fibronectin type III domain-containing protein, partial [Opitutaceae bacterium]